MGDVVTIRDASNPALNGVPNDQVIERVERLLEDAKSGRIQFIAFAAYAPDDSILYSWTQGGNSMKAGAAITRLFFNFNLALDRVAEDG